VFNYVSAPRTRLIAQLLAGGALATILSTAQAQNNFLGDGAPAVNAPKVSIQDLAPDTLTSWVPDRPTGDDLLPPLNGKKTKIRKSSSKNPRNKKKKKQRKHKHKFSI